ncbi:hypothetical protein BBJ28_00024125 [Nothophytophthora sp. Chile5]|nr:hypothetical protein BBJ28_00024125 [Nothophytophthora sp. Chile5]
MSCVVTVICLPIGTMSDSDSDTQSAGSGTSPPAGPEPAAPCDLCNAGFVPPLPPLASTSLSSRDLAAVTRQLRVVQALADDNRRYRDRCDVLGATNDARALHGRVLHLRYDLAIARSRELFQQGKNELCRLYDLVDHLQARVADINSTEAVLGTSLKNSEATCTWFAGELETAQARIRDLEAQLEVAQARNAVFDAQTVATVLNAVTEAVATSSAFVTYPTPALGITDPSSQTSAPADPSVSSATDGTVSPTPSPVSSSASPSRYTPTTPSLPFGQDPSTATVADAAGYIATVTAERDAASASVRSLGAERDALQLDLDRVRRELGQMSSDRDQRMLDALTAQSRADKSQTVAKKAVAERDRARAATRESDRVRQDAEQRAASANKAATHLREMLDDAKFEIGDLKERYRLAAARADNNRAESVAAVTAKQEIAAKAEEEADVHQRRILVLETEITEWKQVLHSTRVNREVADQVCEVLAMRLEALVKAAGGTLDVGTCIKDITESVTRGGFPVAATVSFASTSSVGGGAPATSRSPSQSPSVSASSVGSSPAPGFSHSSPSPSAYSALGQQPPRSASSTSVPSPQPTSRTAATAASSSGSTPRRSARPSTVADTTASDSAAATAAQTGLAFGGAVRVAKRPRRLHVSDDSDEDSDGGSSGNSSPAAPPPVKQQRVSSSATTGVASGASSRSGTSGPMASAGSRARGPGPSAGRRIQPNASGSRRRASSGASPALPRGETPFFGPVFPPVVDASEWGSQDCFPWPAAVRQWTLNTVRVVDIRARLLPVHDWILPTTSIREPAQWNSALITVQNVEALYATTPWQYLTDMVPPLTFAAEDAVFAPLRLRYQRHLQNWARAYWESNHRLPFPKDSAFDLLRADAKQRRSHAGSHFTSVLKLAVELFRAGLADLDVFLDPTFLCFPPVGVKLMWYPTSEAATLEDALETADAAFKWRRFFRPLGSARPAVDPEHPAFAIPRLKQKFVQEL